MDDNVPPWIHQEWIGLTTMQIPRSQFQRVWRLCVYKPCLSNGVRTNRRTWLCVDSQGNEMFIRPAEMYLDEETEELSFYDIMMRARRRQEIVIGYHRVFEERPVINPPNKATCKTWSLDDSFIVLVEKLWSQRNPPVWQLTPRLPPILNIPLTHMWINFSDKNDSLFLPFVIMNVLILLN